VKITLVKLHLVNFKGARNLTVDFSKRTYLIGRNETGKTTLFDGWYWLLFGKDSTGSTEFGIKTTDADGNVLHGLDHSVEGVLSIDGKRLVLKKVYAEKWVKKRGSADSEFTGHSTDYYINDVPAKAKEYKDYIDSLVSEETFRLLTDPMYFNVQMSWQQRRALLLTVCGDITDADVIASDDALAELPAILGDHALDDYRKILAARRTKINKDITAIPVRIDEAERSKPDVDGLVEATVSAQVETLRAEVDAKEAELHRIQTGGEIAEQVKVVAELDAELLTLKTKLQSDALEKLSAQRKVAAERESIASRLKTKIEDMQTVIDDNNTRISEELKKAAKLRQEWISINAEVMDVETDDTCAACGQALPMEKVQEAHDKAVANYNRNKAQSLEDVAKKGTTAKEQAVRLQLSNAKLNQELEEMRHQYDTAEAMCEEAQHEADSLEALSEAYASDLAYVAKTAIREDAKGKLVALRSNNLPAVDRTRNDLIEVRDKLRQTESKLAHFTQIKTLDARIADLKAEERKLAAEYEATERELYLTESFVRAKVALMDERINSKFELTRFRLHQEQINGGLSECCVALYKGVAYDAGLNTGGRILVGLDIIRTLQNHYGIYAPCWVDNDESLTSDVEMDCQLIELIASRKDKVLRVEHLDDTGEAV